MTTNNTGDALRLAADALFLQSAAIARTAEALLALADASSEPAVTPRLLSIDQAAATLGVVRRRVYQLIEAGEIRNTHLGIRNLIPAPEIERFLSARIAS